MASAVEVADIFRDDSELIGVRDITDEFLESYTGTTASYDKAKEDNLNFFSMYLNPMRK